MMHRKSLQILAFLALVVFSASFFVTPAYAQCSYPEYASDCDAFTPPPPPASSCLTVDGFNVSGCCGATLGGNIGLSVGAEVSVNIPFCHAEAGVGASTGTAAFTAGVAACISPSSCTLDFSMLGNITPPSIDAGASLVCDIPDLSFGLNCDLSIDAKKAFQKFGIESSVDFNATIQELTKFINLDVGRAALGEILTRLGEYDNHLYVSLNRWWQDENVLCDGILSPEAPTSIEPGIIAGIKSKVSVLLATNQTPNEWWWDNSHRCSSTLSGLRAMTMQISYAKMIQTMQIGMILDAKLLNETIQRKQKFFAHIQERYSQVNEDSCRMDAVSRGLTKTNGPGGLASRLAYALMREDMLRRLNHQSAPISYVDASGKSMGLIHSAQAAAIKPSEGPGGYIQDQWSKHCSKFFDPSRGDEGCPEGTPPGPYAGKDRDPLDADTSTQLVNAPEDVEAVQDKIAVSTGAPCPRFSPEALKSAQGKEAWLKCRSDQSRRNAMAIVEGYFNGITMPGTGIDPNTLREGTGLPQETGTAVIPGGQTAEENPEAPGGGASYAGAFKAMVDKVSSGDNLPHAGAAPEDAGAAKSDILNVTRQVLEAQRTVNNLEVLLTSTMAASELQDQNSLPAQAGAAKR